MWDGLCANVVNQISTNAQEDDEHYNIHATQHNSLPSTTKDPKKYLK